MIKYALKRVLLFILLIPGIIFIVFFIMDFTPGDPSRLILGERATLEQRRLFRENAGLDRSFPVRYASYVYNVVFKLDFGTSYRTRTPVIDEILDKLPKTVILALSGAFFSSLLGISIGILSAVKQYSRIDAVSTFAAIFFASIPNFWLGMTMLLIFSLHFGILPSTGANTWKHYVLPTAAITFPFSAEILRLTRSLMLETVRQDYVTTARAKGVTEQIIIMKHALRNAMLPIITSLGMTFGSLLGGAIITETVFSIPGLGTHIINAIRMKDTPIVLASTIVLAIFFSLIMLAIDVSYAFIDPRIRARYLK
ncbi:MAG: ABC transporter permease [Synergistaceae bacterium]|jgi:peptide/nickel transport system permease protein|nr:ABC transporter permease [Synergistaceae bacterium]